MVAEVTVSNISADGGATKVTAPTVTRALSVRAATVVTVETAARHNNSSHNNKSGDQINMIVIKNSCRGSSDSGVRAAATTTTTTIAMPIFNLPRHSTILIHIVHVLVLTSFL